MEGTPYILDKFTYPWRYVPHPLVRDAAARLIAAIESDPNLHSLFSEGKMLGVLVCRDPEGGLQTLCAFSGLAGGRSVVEGFVPPIYDTSHMPELRTVLTPQRSAILQKELFSLYKVHNALGECLSISEVFALRGLIPPGGSGECAAPKLLEQAYRQKLQPLAMGEFWYGAPSRDSVHEQGRFYPACVGKCGPLLSWMMQGLEVEENPLKRKPDTSGIEILFEDSCIVVANKPSGMLCSPGLTGEQSLEEYLSARCPVLPCHRLDMDTSGLMVFAKDKESQACIRGQFERREVRKSYLAHLCAGSRPWKGKRQGTIALPLAPDYYDRPRQMVDAENGKMALTDFEILEIFPDGEMDVRFWPRTGRTHQLRVHSASVLGLGRPIKGDALYGNPSGQRLELYADSLAFRHPQSGEWMEFTLPPQPRRY